jgi:hypothetical protein
LSLFMARSKHGDGGNCARAFVERIEESHSRSRFTCLVFSFLDLEPNDHADSVCEQ